MDLEVGVRIQSGRLSLAIPGESGDIPAGWTRVRWSVPNALASAVVSACRQTTTREGHPRGEWWTTAELERATGRPARTFSRLAQIGAVRARRGRYRWTIHPEDAELLACGVQLEELTRSIGLRASDVRYLIRAGELTGKRIGGRWYILPPTGS